MIDQITRKNLLFDFYGKLLSEKKREVMSLYYEEDMSLAEIGSEFGISRAAVFDSLKKGEKELEKYEQELGLLEKYLKQRQAFTEVEALLGEIQEGWKEDKALVERLKQIKDVLYQIDKDVIHIDEV